MKTSTTTTTMEQTTFVDTVERGDLFRNDINILYIVIQLDYDAGIIHLSPVDKGFDFSEVFRVSEKELETKYKKKETIRNPKIGDSIMIESNSSGSISKERLVIYKIETYRVSIVNSKGTTQSIEINDLLQYYVPFQ